MKKPGRPIALQDDAVLAAITRRGGIASPRGLVQDLGVSDKTIRRRLSTLIEQGALDASIPGRVSIPGSERLPLPEEGREIISVLRSEGLDAHLTGFDLLAGRAQQFIFEHPHLVYCEPYAYNATEHALVQSNFIVVPAKSASRTSVPDQRRVVVLRRQSDAERRYRVTANLAPLEKAWVDLFRETETGDMLFDRGEVKQLLSALLSSGADYELILRYANRLHLKRAVESLRNEIIHGSGR